MGTGYYVDGGRDADGPRRDAWVSTGGSKADDAPGCGMAIPQAVVMTVRLLFAATMARVRRIGGAS